MRIFIKLALKSLVETHWNVIWVLELMGIKKLQQRRDFLADDAFWFAIVADLGSLLSLDYQNMESYVFISHRSSMDIYKYIYIYRFFSIPT